MTNGSSVELYDDPNCETKDDWEVYTFKQDMPRTWSSLLERDRTDSDFGGGYPVYTQTYHKHDGLKGQVSCIIIKLK